MLFSTYDKAWMRLKDLPKNPIQVFRRPNGILTMCAVASKGQGKTAQTCDFLKSMQESGAIYVISPSFRTGRYLYDWLGVDLSDAYTDINQALDAIKHIEKKTKASRDEYVKGHLDLRTAISKAHMRQPLSTKERLPFEQ